MIHSLKSPFWNKVQYKLLEKKQISKYTDKSYSGDSFLSPKDLICGKRVNYNFLWERSCFK